MKLQLRFFSLLLFFLCAIISLQAQQDSVSLRRKAGKAITDKFSSTRFLNVEYEHLTPVDFKTRLDEQPFTKGKLIRQNRVNVNLNVPVYKTPKWVFTGSMRYRYDHSEVDKEINVSDLYSNYYTNKPNDRHTFNFAMNSTFISKLFDKPVIYNFSLVGDASQDGFERLYAYSIASLVFKRTESLTMTGGVLLQLDKMAWFPALPVFSLDYKFQENWMLSITLPQSTYIRKYFSDNSRRISFGTSIERQRYYLQLKNYDKSFLYNQSEIRTGFVYEHYLPDHFILSARAGVVKYLKGTLNKVNSPYHDYILRNNFESNFYFNIGLSYNLF